MINMATISDLQLLSLRVTEKSEWLFLKLTCSDGIIGFGEATMEGHELAVKAAAAQLASEAKGWVAFSPEQINQLCLECLQQEWTSVLRPETLRNKDLDYFCNSVKNKNELKAQGAMHRFTVLSALDQAQWDAEGKRRGQPVAALLGGVRQVPRLYANINRGIYDRSPAGFAAAAKEAVAAGFGAIKIAPFDSLDWRKGHDPAQIDLYRAGLNRIKACRIAIGQSVALSVDCHWRFDPKTAHALIEDVTAYDLYWLECPIPETEDAIPAIIGLRNACNKAQILLAGLEMGNGLESFLPYIKAGALDVIMPDVKYAGGITQSKQIAKEAQRYGMMCSPHNPTGPICHAASLHLTTTLPNCPVLEHQFRETPLFDSIVQHAFMPLENGCAPLPTGLGFGVTLHLP